MDTRAEFEVEKPSRRPEIIVNCIYLPTERQPDLFWAHWVLPQERNTGIFG